MIYYLEFMPLPKQMPISARYNLGELALQACGILYFSMLSTEWAYWGAFGFVLHMGGTAAFFCMPESPKYLFQR